MKIMCDYFHSVPTQEVLVYSLEYASILHVQRLYQFYVANSTKHDYQGLQ